VSLIILVEDEMKKEIESKRSMHTKEPRRGNKNGEYGCVLSL
jgi:hypothetical protein